LFCSTIIPTIGRSTLARAVFSVLEQEFTAADHEIIVVNDSGRPLPAADWQQSERVRVINTNRRERSVARNTGAAIARGQYLHFLDDDDWLLPGALESFWASAGGSDVAWLYGRTRLVDRAGTPLIELDHGLGGNCFVQVMAGEWIPLQASLIQAQTFFALGGFNPLLAGPEDVDLVRRVALRGHMAAVEAVVACVGMGVEGSSTDYGRHAEYSRWAREQILNEPGVFARMRASATASSWFGRIVRIYLTSVLWNLVHKRGFTALSRTLYGLLAVALAGRHVLSKGFWRAVVKSYKSETFVKGSQEAGKLIQCRGT
jgi:glycosyltransferase involved in cell wall biosynthesis